MGSTFSLVLGLVNGLPRLNITQGISDTVTSSSNYQQIRIAITIFKKVIVCIQVMKRSISIRPTTKTIKLSVTLLKMLFQ